MDSLLSKRKEFIYMPDSVYAEEIKLQFYLLGRFPSVIGAIDGTHIPIIAPAEDEQLLRFVSSLFIFWYQFVIVRSLLL